MPASRGNRRFTRLVAVAGFLTGLAFCATAADVVILKDGYVIQGNARKELAFVKDTVTGGAVAVPKADGLDMLDEGPRVMIYSTSNRQLGEVGKDVQLRPEYKAYVMPFAGRKSNHPLPGGTITKFTTEYDEKWRRKSRVEGPNGFEFVEQQITYLDPYYTYIVSPTHLWRSGHRTPELEPEKVRKLLRTHPELAEVEGKPEPLKRIALAKFTLDAGWLAIAQDDVASFKKEFTAPLPKDVAERFEALCKEVDTATAALVIKEGDLALLAGRYTYAAEVFATFPEKLATPDQIKKATESMARMKEARDRYDNGRRLLRTLLDQTTGADRAKPTLAVCGGPAGAVWPTRPLAGPLVALVAAGETVHAELHPDSAHRVEFFVNLAAQVEAERKQGRDPSKKPDELLATAISGWAKGKNGVTPNPESALRIWAARDAVLGYQRSNDLNTRNELLTKYKKGNPLPIDELAQIVSLLPPADPEDLIFRSGTLVASRRGIPPDVYRRNSRPTGEHPRGIEYLVHLPPEYHHGRAYPVVIAVTDPNVDPEQTIGSLVQEADRHGYILLAPDWSSAFRKGWQWRGEDHFYVTAVLRDAIRSFCIDNDRVFLFGAGDGGNMAMDVGASHPDLFAGVLAMSPIPKWTGYFSEYWKNAQYLPFYVATGEMSGNSFGNLRQIFGRWAPNGFPSVMAVYKGRGIEWFTPEVAQMFDWMNRKKRVTGAATLQLGQIQRQEWMTMRTTDNRFYWLGVDGISPRSLNDDVGGGKVVYPAAIKGDIRGSNHIDIRSRAVTQLSVWLTHDLIDWTKPVTVSVNGSTAREANTKKDWRPKVLEPDLNLLLEDYRERGDRRNLILARLEFLAVP